jgi:hypothetical protein
MRVDFRVRQRALEVKMKTAHRAVNRSDVPKRRQQHHSYDESVNRSVKLIEDEAVEIEREAPSEENEPVETVEDESGPDAPTFEG